MYKELPPQQENSQEEHKGEQEFDFVAHISKECRVFMSEMKIVDVSLEADIQVLLQQKTEMEKVFANFGKLKVDYEAGFKQVSLNLDKGIQVLKDKIASNKASSEEISSKVCSIIKDAKAQLQLSEIIAVQNELFLKTFSVASIKDAKVFALDQAEEKVRSDTLAERILANAETA